MKKIIIVNNNMKIGGIQKSLLNLLCCISNEYDISLLLFDKNGVYLRQIPNNVKVFGCKSSYRFFGRFQGECKGLEAIKRGFLAFYCKLNGRSKTLKLMDKNVNDISEEFDVAISFMQNGKQKNFYGGANEYVLRHINAKKKIAFVHCDYRNSGANEKNNNAVYYKFDKIAACSDGCKEAFIEVLPDLAEKCYTVRNFQLIERIRESANSNDDFFSKGEVNVIIICRLYHEKGVERAVKAIKTVNEAGINTVLHIVGDGPLRKDIELLCEQYNLKDKVVMYGELVNPYGLLKKADLLLVTSYYEAAPMVIDEAKILNVPVVSVKTTSSKDMIEATNCGWVCENDDQSFEKCLVDVIKTKAYIEKKEYLKQQIFNNDEQLMQLKRVIEE